MAQTPPPSALVLDLRGNRGGVLRQAVLVADSLLQSGPIAETLRPRNAGRVQFGLGWLILGDGDLLMHDGGTLGARCEVRVERRSGTCVVVLGDARRGTAKAAMSLLDPKRPGSFR